MKFFETAWSGFKNLEPRRHQWTPGLNVLSGPNGAGKTNLLESLNILSGWGGFSVSAQYGKNSSLISWNAEGRKAFLLASASGERDVEVQVQIGVRMSLRAAGEKTTYSELRQLVPSLSFLARDIDLLDGTPSVRRLFLDKTCALCSPLYARRLAEYKQLVRQRAALLRRNTCGSAALRATVPPLAQIGGWIRESRRGAVILLKDALEKDPSGILPFQVGLELKLKGSMGLENPAEDIAASLEANAGQEAFAGVVLTGPHRDDLLFSCLGRPAPLVLSRGQKRRVVVAMITAAGRLVEARLRLKPVLLLDDATAELDSEGKRLMGKVLADTGWQIFVTSTENPFGELDCAVWNIQDGKIYGAPTQVLPEDASTGDLGNAE